VHPGDRTPHDEDERSPETHTGREPSRVDDADARDPATPDPADEGGDPPCWEHLLDDPDDS
jgi:hypothetical protein